MMSLLKSMCKVGILLAADACLVLCASCSKDEAVNIQDEPGKLSFKVSFSDVWNVVPTRTSESKQTMEETFQLGDSGLWVTSTEESNIGFGDMTGTRAAAVGVTNFYPSFGVYGYVYTGGGTWKDNHTTARLYVKGQVASEVGTDLWNTATMHYWPGSQYRMKFFAYAPYDAGAVTAIDNQLRIAYTVPEEVGKQVDLLIADDVETAPATEDTKATYSITVPGDYNKPAKLHFYHALTAVKIKAAGDLAGTVKSVRLSGVKDSGVHEFGIASWNTENVDATALFSQDLDVKLSGGKTEDQIITDGEATFMMIPQTLGDDAALEVTFDDGSTLTGSLAGREWPMGRTVVYRISRTKDEYVFEATQPEGFSYKGGNHDFTVTSYRKVVKDGVESREPVRWQTAESAYSTDGGATWNATKPGWLSSITRSGVGEAMSCSSVVSAQTYTFKPDDDKLNGQPMVSGYDLSTQGGKTAVNTANCYIVNAPGSYTLPLVYGNAVKEGHDNTSSYISAVDGENILKTFVNHLDKPISSPYIYENENCEPADAVLVWQDVQNLITPNSIKLSGDKHSLVFEVSKETIKQGNAIVAVRDSERRIMWSWHIWVTDYQLGEDIKTVTDHDGNKYQMMPLNVGWCNGGTKEYAARSVMVKIIQSESGITQVVTINQMAFSGRVAGRNTYYQFGRKDPMLPGENKTNGILLDSKCYSEEYPFVPKGEVKVSIGTSIQNPNILYRDNDIAPYDWSSDSYDNRWSANGASTAGDVVKTIYDPSPVGYSLPASRVFTGFTSTGTASSPESVNGILVGNDDGWNLNCVDAEGRASMIFFPFLGCRSPSDGALSVAYGGYYWTAMPYIMQCNFNGLNPKEGFHRAYAFVVRSVKE